MAPANLALVLPMLPVPAALQALPLPALHPSAPPPGAVPPPPAGPLVAATGGGAAAASGAGPAAGLLSKIGAALGTKAAVVAAGAAVVAGGGVATVKLSGADRAAVPPAHAGASPGVVHHGAGSFDGHARDQAWARHRHGVAAGIAAHHAAETARHAGGARETGHLETGHAGDATTTHDAVTHDAATAPQTSSGTTSTTADPHDGGDAGHDDGH